MHNNYCSALAEKAWCVAAATLVAYLITQFRPREALSTTWFCFQSLVLIVCSFNVLCMRLQNHVHSSIIFSFYCFASVGTLHCKLNKAFRGYNTSDLHPMPNRQKMPIATGNNFLGNYIALLRYHCLLGADISIIVIFTATIISGPDVTSVDCASTFLF